MLYMFTFILKCVHVYAITCISINLEKKPFVLFSNILICNSKTKVVNFISHSMLLDLTQFKEV